MSTSANVSSINTADSSATTDGNGNTRAGNGNTGSELSGTTGNTSAVSDISDNASENNSGSSFVSAPFEEADGDSDPCPEMSRALCVSSKRLRKELADITRDPPPNCTARPKDDNLYQWESTILGPTGSVYEGGVFTLIINFLPEYPFKPPKVIFRTRIYHCNVNKKGLLCMDILEDNWSPVLTVSKILLSICSLLTDCNPYDPLECTIAIQYLQDQEEHDKTARLWTKKYAAP